MACFLDGNEQTKSDGLYAEFFSLEELARYSELIVVAELIESRDERLEMVHPETGATGIFYDDVIRTYKAIEIIKAPLEVGEEFQVWNSYGLVDTGGRRSTEYDLLPANKGEVYVLFLSQGSRNDDPIWGKTASPEKAELIGDRLRFLSTTRYQEAVGEHGLDLVGDSQAPFETTLPQLRELVKAIESSGPIPEPTQQPDPTPAKTVPPGSP